jgi:hypothetical protein
VRILSACLAALMCLVGVEGRPREKADVKGKGVSLDFRATPVRGTFCHGERVVFVFRLRNLGKEDVLVSRAFALDRDVLLHITDAEGMEIAWCGRISTSVISSSDFAILKPGASVSRSVTVSCVSGAEAGYNFSAPGRYSVVAVYKLTEPSEALKQFAGSAKVFRGPLKAPEVSLRIGPRRPKR